jgi:gliding motility-associated-like protein
MKKQLLQRLFLLIFLAIAGTSTACHLSSITLVGTPTSLGGGVYSITVRICTGTGDDGGMGFTCGLGAVDDTEDFAVNISGGGATYVTSGGTYTSSITSGYNGVVSSGSAMASSITYSAPSQIYQVADGLGGSQDGTDVCGAYGGLTQYCFNITFQTTGLPTTISVVGIESGGSASGGCALSTPVPACAPPPAPTVTGASRCGPGTVSLTAAGCGAGGTINWYANAATTGGSLGTGTTFTTPSISSTTTYYATCTNGCPSASAGAAATIIALPTANAGANASYCSGSTTTIGAAAAGGTTYSWSPTTGLSSSTVSNPTVSTTNVTTAPVSTNYTVTATAGGCTATDVVTVTVNPAPTSTFTQTANKCLTGNTFTFTNTATMGAGYTQTWTFGGGGAAVTAGSTTTSPVTISYTTPGTYTITHVVTAAGGCTSTTTSTVTVFALPVVTVNSPTICAGATATLTAAGASTYTWTAGLSSGTGTSVTGSPAATTSYTVTGTNVNGCTDTDVATITVNPLPTVTVPPISICAGLSGTLTASGASTYTWAASTGLSSTTGTSVTASPAATTTYTVTGTSAATCVNTTTVVVTVNPLPVISVPPKTICSGLSTTLTASGASTYAWSPGTGLSATTGTTVTANPTSTTTYTVTGTSAAGCIATTTVVVTVNPLPVVSVPPLTICNGLSGTLTASGASTYSWAAATGLSATSGTSVTANPTATTTYTVTGTSAAGCIATTTVVVTVNPLPVVSVPPLTICNGLSGTLTASGASTYSWAASTGLSATTGASVTANPTSTTTYTVTGTSAAGCIATTTVVVTVNPLPTITVPPKTICAGLSTTLTASGASTYSWAPGTGLSATTGTTVTANPAATTTYTVTGTSATGCINTTTVVVTVNPIPVTVVNSPTICPTQTATLNASGATTYSWSAGLSSTTGASVTGSPASTTSYTVTGTSLGCTSTAVATITIGGSLSITVNSPSVCSGLPATLNASGGTTYTWSAGLSSTTGASVTGSPASTTSYTVTGTTTGCTGTAVATITIIPLPTITVPPIAICAGIPGTLNASGASTYSWAPSTGLSATTGASVTANPAATTTYSVTGTSAAGCVNTTTVVVTVNPLPTITVPPITICAGLSGTITASGASTYTWAAAAGLSATTGTSVTANPGATTTYTVTGTSAAGCVNSTTVIVTVNPLPVIAVSPITICAGIAGTLTASGANTYSWSPGTGLSATTGASVSANPAASTTYTVTGTAATGCIGTATVFVTVSPSATLSIAPKVNVSCFGGTNGSATVNPVGGSTPYTYAWAPSGGSAASATGLAAGTYTVTVTTNNGCISTTTAVITQPTGMTLTMASVNASCGTANGQASVSVAGGTSPYTYSWAASGGTAATATGLAAASYTVTVTDNNSCISTNSVAVNNSLSPSASTTVVSNVSCFGGNNGSASVTISGGSSPYTQAWTPSGGTGTTASSLAAGTYTVTVTDNVGCVVTANATITQPPVLTASTVKTDVTCFGGSTGTATVTAAGGTSPYTYSWAPSGGTGTTASSLAAGTYTVTVTDFKGCTKTATAAIAQPTAITSTMSNTPVSCFGGNNGTASVIAGGGTPGYSYLWAAGGSTTATASALISGTYTVTITDLNGCTKTASTTVNQPTALTATTTVINSTCGASNGSATVTAGGGTTTYSYSWAPSGGSAATASGLTAGTYTVTVTDLNGCTKTATATVNDLSGLIASVSSQTNVSCFGGNNGSVTITASGSTGPYTYSSNGGTTYQASGTFATLTAGSYTITAKDANGCTVTVPVTITQPAALAGSITAQTNILCNGANTGSVTVAGTDGTSPYTYAINGVTFGASGTFSSLTAGPYTITVKDANGCTKTVPVTITQPTALTASITSQTNNVCFGGNTASVTITAAGGTAAYSYSLNGAAAQPSGTYSSMTAGSYTVTVTDANACTTTVPVIITQPTQVTVTAVKTDATCGTPNGTLTATGANGTGPYTYSINGVTYQPSGAFNGLAAASYTVTVKDANGCSNTTTISIVDLSGLVASISSQTNVSCFGGNNGSVTVTASGSTGPYTYSSDGGLTYQASGTFGTLAAGSYTITAKDANGCTVTVPVTITQPIVLTASISAQTNITCFGANNGSVTIAAAGGTTSYLYAIDGGLFGGTAVFSSLTAGAHSVVVKDANGCTATVPVTITQPAVLAGVISSQINNTCFGGNAGSVTIAASGGTTAYSYAIDAVTFSASGTFSSLTAGSYTVTIKDANACTATVPVTITQPTQVTVSAVKTDATCGAPNGTLTATGANGTSPYTYSINGVTYQPSGTFNGLAAASYTVTVKDANGCSNTTTISIIDLSGLVASISAQTNVSCFGGNNGSVTVTASGSTGPYTYSNDGGATYQASGTFGTLAAGSYTITAKDANGCTVTVPVTITQPTVLTASISAQTNITCFGANNGSVTIAAAGGTTPYLYAIDGGGTVSTSTFNSLTAGAHTIIVKDANGCSVNVPVNITQPTALTLATSSVNAICTAANGSATVVASGATPGYTYLWSPGGATTSTASNINAGNYSVLVTDANGCTQTALVNVGQSPGGNATISSSSNVTCAGANDGSATVSMGAGSTPPFTYAWSPGTHTTATASGLAPGTYNVNVVDGNGCTASASVVITEPPIITNTFTNTNVSCFGGSNGTSTINASGGTPGYTYLWTPGGQTTATATNLTAGTYTCVITDANNCTHTATTAITQPTGMTLSETHTDANCNLSNGNATVNVAGGVGPYTYSWSTSPVQTTQTISTLASNTYVATVTDANGCSQTISVTINNLAGPIATLVSQNNVSCSGLNDGNATVTVNGGTNPYSFVWSNGQTLPTATNLIAGSYTLTATDVNGCVATVSATITEPLVLTTTTSFINPKCSGYNNGSITTNTNGGTVPYTYLWSPGGMTTANVTGLTAGTYTVQTTDAHGCVVITTATLNDPAPVVASTTVTNITCNGMCNGIANANPITGTGPYTYLWTDPNAQTTQSATGLCAGTYSVTVTDADGCSTTANANISSPASITLNLIAKGNVTCYGACDGYAQVGVTGGTAPYTYMWAPTGTAGSSVNNLCAGTYTATVTDANGCSATTTVLIIQPNQLIATITNTNVTCYGACDAQATAVYTGGTGPYTFIWTPTLQTTPQIASVCAGVHSLVVTDSLGCQAFTSALITEPTVLAVATTATTSSCGNADGTACAAITGGSPPFVYSWNDPANQTTSCAVNLNANAYTISVTDSHGCSVTNVANVNDINGPVVTIPTSTNVTCFGAANGSAQGSISGGVIPYNISWNPDNQTTSFINNLSGGIYSMVVTDNAGCVGSASVTIDEPSALISGIISSFNTTCNLSCDGAATVLAGGGTAPYTYLWNDIGQQTTATANNLCAQSYTVTTTDNHGCTSSSVATINQPTPLTIQQVSLTNVSCNGGNNGQITVSATGGTPGYTYTWSPTGSGASNTNLAAGTYTVTVTDVRGCSKSSIYTITEPSALVLTSTSNPSTCGNSNGSVGVSITPGTGTAPYSYSWSPIASNSAIIPNISAGSYTVTVTDAMGCTAVQITDVGNLSGPTINTVTYTRPLCYNTPTGTATVSATGGQLPYIYDWSNSGGSLGQANQTATALVDGTYNITITDLNGCVATGTVFIPDATPVVMLPIPTDTICIGQSSQVYGAASGGTPTYTYTWNPAFTEPGPIYTVSPTSTTVYTVTSVDQNGCLSNTETATVFVNPQINVIATDTSVCSGKSVPISATATGGTGGPYTYSWSNGSSSQTQTVTPAGLGNVNYIVTANDIGCSIAVKDTSTVRINPLPFGSMNTLDTAGCEAFNAVFIGNSNGVGYLWNFGDGSTSALQNPSHVYSTVGGVLTSYNVSLTVTSALGCTSLVTTNGFIDVYPTPTAGFSTSPSDPTTTSPVVSFTDLSTGATGWNWDFNYHPPIGIYTDTLQNPTYSYPDSGAYVVQQVVSNNFGCYDTAYHTVEIIPEYILYTPNAFTPFNHDGMNDVFMPKGLGIDPDNFEMMIFDRWGNMIYKTVDISKGWDGKANGGSKVAQVDVYVWKIIAKDFKGETHNYIGHVSIVK